MTLSARAAPDEGNWEMRTPAPDAVVSPLRALVLPAASVSLGASNARLSVTCCAPALPPLGGEFGDAPARIASTTRDFLASPTTRSEV